MPHKNHLRILPDQQLEESAAVKFNYGFGDQEREDNTEPNYYFMATGFREDLNAYSEDLAAKVAAKDRTILLGFLF